MSTYKVIQDIEAEDKLIGPLSLRQFLYAVIVVVLGFMAFKLAIVSPWLAIPFLPPMVLFGVLAAPFGQDQSSEIWLLAKIRFFLKPRKRIWDQSGIKDLVTITVPKKVERQLTDGLSQTEVRSRLHALASTIDSRGWAVKNININMNTQPSYIGSMDTSDRLLDSRSLPQEVSNVEVTATDDILDERNNPTAQHLDQMITASTQAHRQAIVQQMQQAAVAPAPVTQPTNQWFLATPPQAPVQQAPVPVVTPMDEAAFLNKQHQRNSQADPSKTHLRNIAPLGHGAPVPKPTAPVQHAPKPAITQLSQNDDLNISTIARQAKEQNSSDDEVVISLH